MFFKLKIRKLLFTSLFFVAANSFASTSANLHDPLTNAAQHPKQLKWEFDGFFGRFDKASIQRGFQVYKEVCSACHSLKRLSYRNLQEVGFGENEVKQIAAQYLITDGPDEDGEMFERAGLPSDKFVQPYRNENEARASNGGAYPPDLSLITKARHDGANYVYSLLNGYEEAPKGFEITEGKNYNIYFEGRQIAMPAPIIEDEQILYNDGTYATKEQMAIDVVNFLQFAAEPETEHRKKMGVRTMFFLLVLLFIFLAAKKAIWKNVK
jgi:ubiquinol-cytochrome c reductase cytochrome c1 subunit